MMPSTKDPFWPFFVSLHRPLADIASQDSVPRPRRAGARILPFRIVRLTHDVHGLSPRVFREAGGPPRGCRSGQPEACNTTGTAFRFKPEETPRAAKKATAPWGIRRRTSRAFVRRRKVQ